MPVALRSAVEYRLFIGLPSSPEVPFVHRGEPLPVGLDGRRVIVGDHLTEVIAEPRKGGRPREVRGAGPLGGRNYRTKCGQRRITGDRSRPDRSSTSHNPLRFITVVPPCGTFRDDILSLTAEFLTSACDVVNPCSRRPGQSPGERAEVRAERSPGAPTVLS